MTIIVYNEKELNEAFDKNNDDIELGQDITVTNFYGKQFNFILDGKNHTINFNVNNNNNYRYWIELLGTLQNIRITGNIHWTYDNSSDLQYGFILANNKEKSVIRIHHIFFEDFSIFGMLRNAHYGIIAQINNMLLQGETYIHDIAFENCNFDINDDKVSPTRLFILESNQMPTERISFFANKQSIYHYTFSGCLAKNVYAKGIEIRGSNIDKGYGYGARAHSSELFFNSNCSFIGGKLMESQNNGFINDNPNYLAMGFTKTNGWKIVNDKLQLYQFYEDKEIKIVGPDIVKVGDIAVYKAEHKGITEDIDWYIDGVKIETGDTIEYKFTSIGGKKIVAKSKNYEAFLNVSVVDLRIFGDNQVPINTEIEYKGIYEGPTEEDITWQIDDGIYQVGDNIRVTFTTTGNHKIVANVGTISTSLMVIASDIHIEAPKVIKINQNVTFTIKFGEKEVEALWNFNDEKSIKGNTVDYIWKTDGTKRITATVDDMTVTFMQDVIDIKIIGDNHFANGKEHILTAKGTYSEGSYLWSDDVADAQHNKIYNGYKDKDKIQLSVTYIYKNVPIEASIELICYDSKIFLTANDESVGLTDNIILTSSYQGAEKPLSEKLYHQKEEEEWEELIYSSTYTYQFDDKTETIHHFKYSVDYQIQGLIESSITVKTTNKGVKIITPENNNSIYINFPVQFKGESFGIANPTYKWSMGNKGDTTEYTFTEAGNKQITLTCEDENKKVYDDSINLVIWEQDEIIATIDNDKFYPSKPIYFNIESSLKHPFNCIWDFNSETKITEKEGKYVFKNPYKDGEKVEIRVTATFIDDLGNTFTRDKRFELTCVIPSVTITKPSKDINIFANTIVELACETKQITNPSFEWSTGDKTKECKHIFKDIGKQSIMVTCKGDEGVYMDIITVNIIDYPTLRIEHPDYFINKVPVQFTDNSPYLSSILWKFSNGTLDYGTEITKTFNGYKDGELIECEVTGTFIDDNETIIQLSVTFSIECVTPKITIVLPEKDVEIYENFDIPFKAETKYITNPRFNWSTGEKEQEFEHKFKFGDSGEISVICECEESDYTKEVYKDSVNINIMKTDEINIISPESTKFINDRPVQFTADAEHEFNIVWFFPNDIEYYEKSFNHTFSGYNGGDTVTIDVMAQFVDDLGNIVIAQKTITLICIEPSVTILAPIDGSRIYTNFDVTFEAKSNYITNPHFSWSISDDKEPIMKRRFANGGTYNISVTCEGDEGIFTNSITIYVMERDVVNIIAPSIFQNNVPVKFIAEHNHPCTTSWEFPNEEYDTGYEVEHTFTGYNYEDVITVTLYATFEDDLKNTFVAKKSIELLCSEYVCSFYENSKGKRFYFDKSCRILQQGMTGFSEIQLATATFATKEYNIINGINYIDRQITFNVLIPYTGRKETPEDIKKLLAKIHAKKRELIHELTPTKELGTFYYVRDDGQVFSMKCNIALGYPIFQDETSINGWFGTISFIAPNGYWEGEEITEKSDEINNLGDIPCGFKAKLTENLINETNKSGIYALSDKSLNGYRIDTSEGLIVDNNGNNAWKDINVNSTLVKLEIGKNIITGCETVTYKPRYLGI